MVQCIKNCLKLRECLEEYNIENNLSLDMDTFLIDILNYTKEDVKQMSLIRDRKRKRKRKRR